MLEFVSIRGFQAHERIEFSVSPITTIVGSTDRGKSSIVRALNWVMRNRPTGMAFVRQSAERARVQIKVDGETITRYRSGSDNYYKHNTEEYRAIRGDVPPSIVQVLNLFPDAIQQQHDSHFWVTLPSAQLSHAINEVFDLSLLDRMLFVGSKKKRATKQRAKLIVFRQKELRKKRKELAWHKNALSAIRKMESAEKQIEKLEQRQQSLRDAVRDITREQQLQEAAAAWKQMRKRQATIVDNENKAELLQSIISTIAANEHAIPKLEKELAECTTQLTICPKCQRPL